MNGEAYDRDAEAEARKAAWLEAHPRSTIEMDSTGRHVARDKLGGLLARNADLSLLMDVLDGVR